MATLVSIATRNRKQIDRTRRRDVGKWEEEKENRPVTDVTKISSVVTGSPDPSSQPSSSSQDGGSWVFSLRCFGLRVVGDLVGAPYTGVIMSSANREKRGS